MISRSKPNAKTTEDFRAGQPAVIIETKKSEPEEDMYALAKVINDSALPTATADGAPGQLVQKLLDAKREYREAQPNTKIERESATESSQQRERSEKEVELSWYLRQLS